MHSSGAVVPNGGKPPPPHTIWRHFGGVRCWHLVQRPGCLSVHWTELIYPTSQTSRCKAEPCSRDVCFCLSPGLANLETLEILPLRPLWPHRQPAVTLHGTPGPREATFPEPPLGSWAVFVPEGSEFPVEGLLTSLGAWGHRRVHRHGCTPAQRLCPGCFGPCRSFIGSV